MHRWYMCAIVLSCLFFSCSRPAGRESAAATAAPPESPPLLAPYAIVQSGEYPLWFQFTGGNPQLIESIEDAAFSAALVPWPLAIHVRGMLAQGDDLLMAVNRDGFIRFSPDRGGSGGASGLGLYRFPGGEFWRQYTVAAFALFDEPGFQSVPAALLYRDDRFVDSNAPLPSPRLWTFGPYTSKPQSFALPALDAFAPEDGWDIDALRRGGDGLWYYRAVQKEAARPELRMLYSGDMRHEGEQVSLGAFQSAALPEHLEAAPSPLRDMLTAAFAESGGGLAAIVSPEFQSVRSFAVDREKPAIFGYYSVKPDAPALLLASEPRGDALYMEAGAAVSVKHCSLPALPEGFVYTGIAVCGGSIIASWEEQDEYSIGAAGLMVIRCPW